MRDAMPQASDEQRHQMFEYFGDHIDDGPPRIYLQNQGYTLTPQWEWIPPSRVRTLGDISEKEARCIDFLVDEWDFGGVFMQVIKPETKQMSDSLNTPPPFGAAPSSAYNKLSTDSANKLYEEIRKADNAIDDQLRNIARANQTITTCHNEIDNMYLRREELAAELDKFAAEDWTPPTRSTDGVAMAPCPPAWNPPRFRRPHPLAARPVIYE